MSSCESSCPHGPVCMLAGPGSHGIFHLGRIKSDFSPQQTLGSEMPLQETIPGCWFHRWGEQFPVCFPKTVGAPLTPQNHEFGQFDSWVKCHLGSDDLSVPVKNADPHQHALRGTVHYQRNQTSESNRINPFKQFNQVFLTNNKEQIPFNLLRITRNTNLLGL